MEKGLLYIVATPIGNLADISQRAIEVLGSVSLIAAEDTRHSRKLLSHLGLNQPLLSLHDHNERSRSAKLIDALNEGKDIAVVSDAGTPMISDPGYHLLRAAQDADIQIVPIPGASAVVTALSVSGLPANRFYFHGFLPEKQAARKTALQGLTAIAETLVFYESGKRVEASLQDMQTIFGGEREAVVCRELTKIHEQIRRRPLAELRQELESGQLDQRGEFVLLVDGAKAIDADVDLQLVKRLLQELGDSLSAGQAASAISRALKCPRKLVYQMALQMKGEE